VIIFRLLSVNVTIEALCAVIWGVLVSGGDTKYLNIANLICLWGFLVCPVIVLFALNKLNSTVIVYLLSNCWIFSCLLLVYRRYKSLK
jgi:Na+-driven multidrug efflux pump